jgi:dTDP-4-amino-4,6-dideoxygalactose transaminase
VGGTNIPLHKVFMSPRDALMPRLEAVLYGGQISEGEPVYEFERRFAAFIGADHSLSFYSGTATLHIAMLLAGVGPGDEVISTPVTAEPSNLAILHAGGTPVWADVDPRNGNLDPDSVRARITPKTRAILAVHYGGIPAPLEALGRIAREHGLPVIEDAAHALGARYGGVQLGTHSDYVMFSLQAIKHLTTVDGGMLTCRREADRRRARLLRWFGIDRQAPRLEADIAEPGFKYHMNNVNATIGLVQLEHVGAAIARHVENGRWFDRELRGIPGLGLCAWEAAAEPSYWFYTVLAERRDALAQALAGRGIGCSMSHRRNDAHSVFAASRRDLPGVDAWSARMLHIPCGWWVSDADRERIAAALRAGW